MRLERHPQALSPIAPQKRRSSQNIFLQTIPGISLKLRVQNPRITQPEPGNNPEIPDLTQRKPNKTRLLLSAILPLTAFTLCARAELPLMPWPAQVTTYDGYYQLSKPSTNILDGNGASDQRVIRSVNRLPSLGLQITVTNPHPGIQQYGDDESYHLLITPENATLTAPEPLGALRGVQTILQLLNQGTLPAVDITDRPRFAWRGLSLDVSRHFLSPTAVKRTLDGMAAVKLNVFHWHLSDDQGFRVESLKFPLLQSKGSDGLFYTQNEIREIVAYAADRGIRVVPEFDIPGHATSWFAAYPSLATGRGPYSVIRQTGVHPATMDPSRESTYRFIDTFIAEMAGLFPDAFFHIGGDEVNAKGEWRRSQALRLYMRRNHILNFHELQADFNRRVQKIVAAHGKRMEGWDEILDPDLPKSIVIQSWRGPKSLAEAAKQGYSGILSSGYYLDLMYPASRHYAVAPMQGETAQLNDEERARVMGGEAAMWEELATEQNIDSRLWPRLAAIAERLWSPETVTDVDSMYRRLESVSAFLESQGVEHHRQLRRMLNKLAGDANTDLLEDFASILEPVKGYARHRNHKDAMTESLDHLVDGLFPESEAARRFNSSTDPEYLRARLQDWRRIATRVLPVLRDTPSLAENVPVAESVLEACSLGLNALDGKPVTWTLPALSKKDEILLPFEPGIRKLLAKL